MEFMIGTLSAMKTLAQTALGAAVFTPEKLKRNEILIGTPHPP
jgi:hypothetical protein